MHLKALSISGVLLALIAVQLVYGSLDSEETYEDLNSLNPNHNLSTGTRVHGDRLLKHVEIKYDRRFWWWRQYDFVFPTKNATEPNLITFIKVEDLVPNDEGGYPTITKGGPYKFNVTIHLESRWNKGIDFKISVYGF